MSGEPEMLGVHGGQTTPRVGPSEGGGHPGQRKFIEQISHTEIEEGEVKTKIHDERLKLILKVIRVIAY